MKTLVAIGEALIDFAPQQAGRPIKDTESFMPKVGGAPANVCGAYAKLGGRAVMLTQLGTDPFGDKIVEELAQSGIDTTYISRTEEAIHRWPLWHCWRMETGSLPFSESREQICYISRNRCRMRCSGMRTHFISVRFRWENIR